MFLWEYFMSKGQKWKINAQDNSPMIITKVMQYFSRWSQKRAQENLFPFLVVLGQIYRTFSRDADICFQSTPRIVSLRTVVWQVALPEFLLFKICIGSFMKVWHTYIISRFSRRSRGAAGTHGALLLVERKHTKVRHSYYSQPIEGNTLNFGS